MSGTDQVATVRDIAGKAWRDLQDRGVLPTPQNFELWYTYLENSDPELSRRLSALLAVTASPTQQQLQALYPPQVAQEMEFDQAAGRSEQLDDAAQSLMNSIKASQTSVASYGEFLSTSTEQLVQGGTVARLAQIVASLVTETKRASERNHSLEQQLSSSTSRISKLRTDLVNARQEATTDGLTGLRNRREFDSRLRRAINASRESTPPLCVLFIDVDHFKRFNDEHGHQTGDLVLRLVAAIIADNVKGRDTAARYGGEEFAVILESADLKGGLIVAEQIRAALDGKHIVSKVSGRRSAMVTISAGVAQLRPGDTATKLVERADAAMYEAKRLGRNRVWSEPTAGVLAEQM